MIISPFFQVNESEILVAVRNIAYTVNIETNEMKEVEGTLPAQFLSLVEALNKFEFNGKEIKWYHGVNRMSYNIEEGKYFLGNSEILSESFVNHITAAGIIRYADKPTAELFVEAANNSDKFIVLDFVQTFESKLNTVDAFLLGENIYLTTFNKSTRIQKFQQAKNANTALEVITEKTGLDATTFLAESLEGEAAERVIVLKKIEDLNEMVHFLKDQRNLLADADRSIEEIKAADALIEGEIKKFEAEIASHKENL